MKWIWIIKNNDDDEMTMMIMIIIIGLPTRLIVDKLCAQKMIGDGNHTLTKGGRYRCGYNLIL